MRFHWLSLGLALSACLEPDLPVAEGNTLSVDAGPAVCNARTCTGCCLDTVCLGGNHDTACGYSGRACQECSGDSRCESPGACFAKPRDGGTPSGAIALDAGIRAEVLQRCTFWPGYFFCG